MFSGTGIAEYGIIHTKTVRRIYRGAVNGLKHSVTLVCEVKRKARGGNHFFPFKKISSGRSFIRSTTAVWFNLALISGAYGLLHQGQHGDRWQCSIHESNKDDKTFMRYIVFIHAETTLCLKIIYCMLLWFDTKNWPLLKAGVLQNFDVFINHNLHWTTFVIGFTFSLRNCL